jgi:UPF0716 protein FxsA
MGIIAKLLILFTIVPIIEITMLISLHGLVGFWWTFATVCVTATLGTILTRWQGTAALRKIKGALSSGTLPGEEILDGVLVLLAGATLITPGVLTDTVGLLLLIPAVRAPIRRYVKRRFIKWLDLKAQTYTVRAPPVSQAGYYVGNDADVIDITPD